MVDRDPLYKVIGKKIRARRQSSPQNFSQAKLAKHLGISRASMVNIEAGRQHAPIDLLWRIAEALEVELISLIPKKAELTIPDGTVKLDEAIRKQIRLEAKGNPALQTSLTNVVSRLLTTIESGTKS